MKNGNHVKLGTALMAVLMGLAGIVSAQPAAPPRGDKAPARGRGPQGPTVVSPEVRADRTIVFRLLAQTRASLCGAATFPARVGAGRRWSRAKTACGKSPSDPLNRAHIATRMRSTVCKWLTPEPFGQRKQRHGL